jgi:hypothetical protein
VLSGALESSLDTPGSNVERLPACLWAEKLDVGTFFFELCTGQVEIVLAIIELSSKNRLSPF